MENEKLRTSLLILAVIVSFGTLGYHFVEDMEIFDAFYMTLITISTVGFSEIKPLSATGRFITLVIIVSGISVLTYTLGQVLKIFVEGELSRMLGRRKLEKEIARLKDHYIICGYGRIGQIIAKELAAQGIPLVVIEKEPENSISLEKSGFLHITMDATTEEALIAAGILQAKGIVTAVRSDANNVFISLTAKGLRPDIFILSRASEEKNEEKLRRAGASRVVCPYIMGGRRMAQILKQPTVVDFIDSATMNSQLGLRMEEMLVSNESGFVGKTLIESRIRNDFGVIIIAIKKPSNEMIFNPLPTEKIGQRDVLVVIGKKDDLIRMNEVL